MDLTPTLNGDRSNDPPWKTQYEVCFVRREGLYHNRGKKILSMTAAKAAIFPVRYQSKKGPFFSK